MYIQGTKHKQYFNIFKNAHLLKSERTLALLAWSRAVVHVSISTMSVCFSLSALQQQQPSLGLLMI